MAALFRASAPVRRAPVARVFGPLARFLNPILVPLAGNRFIPIWAVVRHRGRRSARAYATPIAVARMGDALFIPLPFGSRADWLRNVLTAGGCVIRWKGAEHEMTGPEVIDTAQGMTAFNSIEGWALKALGIQGVLRVRFVTPP